MKTLLVVLALSAMSFAGPKKDKPACVAFKYKSVTVNGLTLDKPIGCAKYITKAQAEKLGFVILEVPKKEKK